MGQRIKRFDFVSRDTPHVGFESRGIGDYPARFGEHFQSLLVNGSPLSSKKRNGSFYGGVTIDSIYYYRKVVYQDVNMRSYFGSIRPPTRLTIGFRIDRCILLHFPKRIIWDRPIFDIKIGRSCHTNSRHNDDKFPP